MSRMAYAMGLGEIADNAVAAEAVATAVTEMNARLNLPSGLAALGVTRADYAAIIKGAMADHCHAMNPRLATEADYTAMLDAAM